MKKVLLILISFFLVGCEDYVELNNLKVISTILVDKEGDDYVVNLELINTSKNAKEGSYFVEGKGRNFEEALENVYEESAYNPYYSHLDALIVSKDLAKDGLEELYEPLLRNIEVRRDFLLFVSEDIKEISEYKTDPGEYIGELVQNLNENSIKTYGYYYTPQFREVIYNYLRDIPYIIGEIDLENDLFKLGDCFGFKNDKLITKLDKIAVLVKNMFLKNNDTFQLISKNTYDIHQYGLGVSVEKKSMSFDFKGVARFVVMRNGNGEKVEELEESETDIETKLKEEISDVIEYSKKLDIDFLGLDYLYFTHFPKNYEKGIWKTLSMKVDANIDIGEKGMILEALGGKNDEE